MLNIFNYFYFLILLRFFRMILLGTHVRRIIHYF